MDFGIPEEFREQIELTRRFASEEMRVAENALDRIADPQEAYSSEIQRAIAGRMRSMGFHKLTIPAALGGLGLPKIARYLIEEELAVGGAGLTAQTIVGPIAANLIASRDLAARHAVFKEYLEAYLDDVEVGHGSAWAITEPDAGSDVFTFGRPGVRFRARATPGGGGYVIDGAKSAWCSNGWLADMFVLMACVDPEAGMEGTGTFLVPADWPGVSKGRPIDKIGLRALNQCEVLFDRVEVPHEFMIAAPGAGYRPLLESFVTGGNTSVGVIALGVARAAYEHGLAYAREREQGGGPIIRHQLVARKLFDAYRSIEAARLLLLKSAWSISRQQGRPEVSFAARVQACETCVRVTTDMMFLHGGCGTTREYPVEKLYRDAGPLQIMDGTVDRVALLGAALL